MKKIVIIVLLELTCFVAGCQIGWLLNNGKHYEAACLQEDFIHSLMDDHQGTYDIGSEVEESWYEWFQDLDCGIYGTKHVKSIKDLDGYSWSY